MVEATEVNEKQKLSPIEQVKNIAVTLGLEGADEINLSHKIDLWKQEFITRDAVLACVKKLHQHLFKADDPNIARKYREAYRAGRGDIDHLLHLIDPDKILDDKSVQRIKSIWT